MISKYNNLSFLLGLPGIILIVAGMMKYGPAVRLIGSELFFFGMAFYARAKGRNPAWSLILFIPVIGFIVLVCLKDKSSARRFSQYT